MRRIFCTLLMLLTAGFFLDAGENRDWPEVKKGLEKTEGFFSFYRDPDAGKIYLAVNRLDQEFLYINTLTTGLGSNDIGLDRNQLGAVRVVRFVRTGPKLLLVECNQEFRAPGASAAMAVAVRDAFAPSVLWGFKVIGTEAAAPVVDLTDFLLSDQKDVIGRLQRSGQGKYRLEPSRCAFYDPGIRNFPENTEFETLLTYVTERPGREVRSVAPDPRAVTLRQHHSFVKLPGEGFAMRPHHIGCGFIPFSYRDYTVPVDEPLEKIFIRRHRLKKKDPSAPVSEAVKPIVYYVDPGAPEEIQRAIIEGAGWWDRAFAAIGYQNAFQVKVLPEGADPWDIRYNMIHWVHRSSRGWSYGGGVADPRSGEVIKASITLGSLRIRQDYRIFQSLLGDFSPEGNNAGVLREAALLRIRQLACHEAGHALGLVHNYAASGTGRASVMDYPFPRIQIREDGSLDLSDAYTRGVGEWDQVTIRYGYQDFPEGVDENRALEKILQDASDRGLIYLSDADARGAGSAHPRAHLWDEGPDAVAELKRIMEVRRIALENFDLRRIPPQTPVFKLEELLVPAYLIHRYQIAAAVKGIGGRYYHHRVKSGAGEMSRPVPAAEQRQALETVLRVVEPENLAVNRELLNRLTPPPPGYGRDREFFQPATAPVFDPLTAADTVAHLTFSTLLDHRRAARLVLQKALDQKQPGLGEVIERALDRTLQAPRDPDPYHREIRRTVTVRFLHHLVALAGEPSAAPQVRAVALRALREQLGRITANLATEKDPDRRAHLDYIQACLTEYLKHPDKAVVLAKVPYVPPGEPI